MYLSAVVAFAMLPFLVGAVPVSPSATRAKRIPITKKSNYLREDGSVDSMALDASINHTKEKFKRTRELYERNIITPRTDTNNNVNLYNHSSVQGVQWTGNVAVGSSYQIMKVVFDTVFADTYLVGSGCSECENYNSDYYNFNSSATAVNYKQIITSTFFDLGYVSGYLIMDDLRLGDFQARQKFVVASSVTSTLQSPNFYGSGLLGLGLSASSSLNNSESYFGNLFIQEGFRNYQSTIGFLLSDELLAEIVIAETPNESLVGELTFVKLNSLGYWQIPCQGFKVNGNDITLTTTNTVMDLSNPLITADLNTIANIYSNIPNSAPSPENPSQYTIPCNTDVPISVTYAGTVFNILPSSYVLGPVSAGSMTCIGGFGILDSELDPVTIHMGLVFMNFVYTQLDIQNLQIGLAPIATPT